MAFALGYHPHFYCSVEAAGEEEIFVEKKV
jgi:hypothetical protein